MFQGVKNQMLAKIQIEKFLSCQYVRFIDMVCDLLINKEYTKGEVEEKCRFIRAEIMKKYNLSEYDIYNEKKH